MIKRYQRVGGPGSSSISTYVQSNIFEGETAQTKTYNTTIKGAALAIITFKVTTLNHSNPGYAYTVDGVSHILNDIFTKTLDGSGLVTFTQFIDAGTSTPGNVINVILTLESSTNGTITSPNNTNIEKTT